jgi:hypothetical protein
MKHDHPSEADLSLFAGGDCGRLQRFRLKRHLKRCGDCRDTVASFGELRSAMLEHSPLEQGMPEMDWDRLAGEMRANIRLGLAAGECVREPRNRVSAWGRKWQFAIGAAAVLLVAGAGIFLNGLLPVRNPSPTVGAATVLRSTEAGVEIRTDSGSMMLLNHGDVAGSQTVSGQGAIRARYVDGDTGTVTITSVYVE